MTTETKKSGLFQELVRRRVIKVLVIYGGGAWAVTELITAMADAWGLPQQVIRITLLAFIAGFPLVAVLAWLYDIRDRRIHRTGGSDWRFAMFATLVIGITVLGLWLVLRVAPEIAPQEDADRYWLPELPDARASVAVLPFLNMSGDVGNDYFSDGISEEILNSLSKIADLRIPSRTSSFAFKGKNVDIRIIANQLRVGLILEGSVRTAGDRVRITAQLIDVTDDRHVWSETYDRNLTDIFAIQTDIANQIAARLSATLGDELPNLAAEETDLDAYDLYLQARKHLNQRDSTALASAIELLERSVMIDPGFASGHAALGVSYLLYPVYGAEGWAEFIEKSRSAAQLALELDPDHPVALSTLGKIYEYELRWADSRAMYERAIAANPGDSTTRHWLAMHLRRSGYGREALRESLLAADLNPQHVAIVATVMVNYYLNGEQQRALDLLEQKLREGLFDEQAGYLRNFRPIHQFEYRQFDAMRQFYREMMRARDIPPEPFEPVLANIGAASQSAESSALLAQAENITGIGPESIAMLHVFTGAPGKALQVMIRADARNQIWFSNLIWFPALNSLLRQPEFGEFIEVFGLGDYWRDLGAPDQCRPVAGSFSCQ